MNYRDFKGEDFAKDAFFIKWVKGDPEADWFWKTFLNEHPEKAGEIERGREVVKQLVAINRTDLIEKDLHVSMRNQLILSLKATRESQKEIEHAVINPKLNHPQLRFWIAIAASVVLLIATLMIVNHPASVRPAEHTLQTYNVDEVESISTDSTELRINPRGQKSVMLLADGSKVWLNADSKLTYAKDFGERDTRDVFLEGEAFFEVVRNPNKPFIVHTSDLKIKVLGTSFNVKSYADDGSIETTLVEGKVEIDNLQEASDKEQKLILRPNEKATFLKASLDIEVKQVVVGEVVAWRNDRLVFKSEAFSEVIKQLERWYNVKIHVEENAQLSCPLTASIEKESLEEILDFLAVTHKISFAVSGNDVYIKGSVCK